MNFKKYLSIKRIKLSDFTEISRDIGQIFFAAMVIAPIVEQGYINWSIFLAGSFLAVLSWLFSVIINEQ
jgi:hypothetical protein